MLALFFPPYLPTGLPGLPDPVSAAQIPFEQVTAELLSPDANVRLRAAHLLKDAAYPEAAVPLAKLVTDADDEVQIEAIAAELNIFLAEEDRHPQARRARHRGKK